MTHGSFGITLNGDTQSHFERERTRVMRYLERDGSLVWCECVFPLCQNSFIKGPLAPSRHFFLRLLWSPELKPWTCFATAMSPCGSGSFQEWYSLSKLAIGIDFSYPSWTCTLVKNSTCLTFLSFWSGCSIKRVLPNTLDHAGTSFTAAVHSNERRTIRKGSTNVLAFSGEVGKSRQGEFKHICWV